MMIWGSIFPITVPRKPWEKEAEKYLYEASAFLHFGLQDPSLIDIEVSSKKKCYQSRVQVEVFRDSVGLLVLKGSVLTRLGLLGTEIPRLGLTESL